MKAPKIIAGLVLTVLFGKAIPLVAVFLLIGAVVIIFADAIKEGKQI